MHEIIHSLLHSLEHTLPLIPFLYLTYLFMEILERNAGDKMEKIVTNSGKVGPLLGALLGVIPQCGFSAVGSGLYAGRLITTGTLIAIFLSTSDEMLPLLVSSGASPVLIVKILVTKAIVAAIAGFAIDGISRLARKGRESGTCEPYTEYSHCAAHCHHENTNIFLAALIHTLKITVGVFAVSFALTVTFEFLGEDFLARILGVSPVVGCLISAIVGLIPNCASSIAITQLYLQGVISAGSMLSGLFVGVGMGILILLRANRPLKDSLRVIAILFATGLIAGFLFDILSLGTLIGI